MFSLEIFFHRISFGREEFPGGLGNGTKGGLRNARTMAPMQTPKQRSETAGVSQPTPSMLGHSDCLCFRLRLHPSRHSTQYTRPLSGRAAVQSVCCWAHWRAPCALVHGHGAWRISSGRKLRPGKLAARVKRRTGRQHGWLGLLAITCSQIHTVGFFKSTPQSRSSSLLRATYPSGS